VTFTVKDWQDTPSTATPITAAALEDLETRIAAYADTRQAVVNVKDYGAVGNGSTDDRVACQAAIDAATTAGLPCYFPAGAYAISGTLKLHKGSRLVGNHTSAWMPTSDRRVVIQAKSGFSGSGILEAVTNTLTGDAAAPSGGSIEGLCLSGANIAANGIVWLGTSADWTVTNVEATNCTSHGFRSEGYLTENQQEVNFFHCHSWQNSGAGFYFSGKSYDHRLLACVAHGNAGEGFSVQPGSASIELVSCRAEFNGSHGFLLYGPAATAGIGKLTLNGCVDDANEQNGIYVEHAISGAGPVLIANHYGNRSGNNGGSGARAGIRVHASTQPVVIQGYAGRTGFNDGGGGIERPAYGLNVTGSSTHVMYGGFFDGVTNALSVEAGSTAKSTGAWFESAGTRAWQPPSTS
jgi:hypothetical protein